MHRKMARPTDNAGKVIWNAAVVANCHRDRSMKVCEFIFSVFLGWGPAPDNDHDGAVTPVPHPGRRAIRLPASGNSVWRSAGGLVAEMAHAPTTVRHKNLFTERTVVQAPIQGIPLHAGELLHDPGAERRQVVRPATGGDVLVGDHLLVDDMAARVADVGPDAWVG